MATMTFTHLPNKVRYHDETNSTTWHDVTSSLDAGFKGYTGTQLVLKSVSATHTDGSPFYYAINQASTPSNDNDGQFCSGGGQTFSVPGPIHKLYIRKTVATDEIVVDQQF